MTKTHKELEVYGVRKLAEVYAGLDHEQVHAALCADDPNFALIEGPQFALEYAGGRLAMACRAWEAACLENGVKDEGSVKIFLRAVMNSFKTPEHVAAADAFSSYLHCGDEDQGAAAAVTEKMFQRIKVDAILSTAEGSQRAASAAFERLMLLSESFRTEFENDFFEFIHS